MLKRLALLTMAVLGITLTLGCSEGRRGMSIHGPYHDVNLAYDIEEDDYGEREVRLVRIIERRD